MSLTSVITFAFFIFPTINPKKLAIKHGEDKYTISGLPYFLEDKNKILKANSNIFIALFIKLLP